jgi:tetratricopeptide (TPR) repeat protein
MAACSSKPTSRGEALQVFCVKIFPVRKAAATALGLLVLAASACAPKPVIAPVVTAPKFPDYIRPQIPPALAADPAVPGFDRGWRFLQSGDFRNAERELMAAVHLSSAFYPAEAALGYVDLARKDAKSAVDHFDRALAANAASPSALDGKGEALLLLGRDADALAAFDAAASADPSLVDLRRRADVLRLRVAERQIASARDFARAGKLDDAVRAYQAAIASSPESAFLYRELGAVQRQQNDSAGAMASFRKASDLDPSDAASIAQIADMLDAAGDFTAAIAAYNRSLAIEPSAAVETRRDQTAARAALASLPEQYRAIADAPQITRADLAALIGVKLTGVLQTIRARDPGVVTDVRGNWAEPWIMAATRAGIMDPLPNHTFQPRAIVRRVDLAEAVGRLIESIAAPQTVASWRASHPVFSDLAESHLAYPSVSIAIASGVMERGRDSSFQPSRVVTGAEAAQAIDRLRALAVPAGQGSIRR